MLYLLLSLIASHKQAWPVVTWFLVLVAGVVPFAFLLVEVFISKELKRNKPSI